MTEPQPLRCETCGKDDSCPYDTEGNNTTDSQRNRRYQRRMVTVSRGCVSHSSTTSAEQVLEELKNRFRKVNEEGGFRPWNLGHIEEVIREFKKELQQRGRERER